MHVLVALRADVKGLPAEQDEEVCQGPPVHDRSRHDVAALCLLVE